MPVYEYVCASCQKTTEALRKMSDADAPLVCEHCGSDKTKRGLSMPLLNTGGSARGQSQGGHVHSGSCGCGKPRGSCGM